MKVCLNWWTICGVEAIFFYVKNIQKAVQKITITGCNKVSNTWKKFEKLKKESTKEEKAGKLK